MNSSIFAPYGRLWQPTLLSAMIFLSGLVVSALVARNAQAQLQSKTSERFLHLTENFHDAVIRRFGTTRFGLGGARGVFAASKSVERKEFEAYVASRDLQREFPGILGMGVIKPVARIDLERFIAAEQLDDAPDFNVKTTGNDPQCFVITCIYPRATNAAAWGFDVGSEAVRRAGIEQAIDHDQTTLTRTITLVQDELKTPGFLLLVPVYRNGTAPKTPTERQAALVALVYAPIRAVDLLAGLNASGNGQAVAEVWEESANGNRTRLFPTTENLLNQAAFSKEEVLTVFGRDLHLRVCSTPELDATVGLRESLTVMGAGSLIAVLAAMVALMLGRSRAKILTAAHAMTMDLREAKAAAEIALRDAEVYRSTLEQYAIVSMTDGKGRIISVNPAFCSISGYSREELLGQDHRLVNSSTHSKEFWRTMWEMVQSGKPWRQVVCNRAKNGSLYWVDSMITPFMGPDGKIDRLVSIRFDVTAQKQLEQELLSAKERLSIALMAGGVGIWEYDPVANRLTWDEGMFALYDVAPELFPGAYEAWESAIHPEDKARSVSELNAGLAGTSDFDTQFRIVWRDGAIRHIRARALVKRDESGKAVRMIGTNWDITAENESEAQRKMLVTIIEQATDFIGTKDLNGRLQYHNPASIRLLGMSENIDISTLALSEIYPQWAVRQLLDEAMPSAKKNHTWQGESALLHRDGSEIPVYQVLMVHRNAAGEPMRFSTIMRDLREQKAHEANLRSLTAMQQGILDGANVCIIATDINGLITNWNATATRMLQWTADEMVGKQSPAVIHVLDEVVARATQLSKELGIPVAPGFDVFVIKARINRVADEHEWTYVRKDSSRFPVLLSVTALRDDQGAVTGYLGIAADITERSRHERELKKAMEAATAGARAKADFLAVMSHEIRTPMNGVIGMTNLLVKTALDAQQRDYVETVRTCGESLLILINDILDFSKLEAGRVTLEAIPFSLKRVMEDVLLLFGGLAEQKGITLSYELPPNTPHNVIGDPTRLRQVLLNLVSNALKFTLQGSVTVSMSVTIRAEQQAEQQAELVIAIRDSGIGMTPEQLAHLGEAFTQADSSTTRKFGGSGLGMTISKALINLMKGELQVESQLGQGSTFRLLLRLPLCSDRPDDSGQFSLQNRRVLCLDNDPICLQQMSAMCRAWGMQVETFTVAQDLMIHLRQAKQPPDLILTDHEMPGIDGLMLTSMVHADVHFTSLPVIIASSDPERARIGVRTSGAYLVLDKPLTDARLSAAIHAALRPRHHAAPSGVAEPVAIRLQRILVADDNRINQRVIVSMIKGYAPVIDTVDNGAKAVEAVKQQQYDCVFMDCQMPEMDGYQATQAIRAREQELGLPHLHIIALTAHAMEGARNECLAAGMDDYLSKPVREADLTGVMQRCFSHTATSSENLAKPTQLSTPDPLAFLRQSMDENDIRLVAEAVALEYPKMMKAIDDASEVGDLSGIARIAHNFKGSSSSLELNDLQEVSRELEVTAKVEPKESLNLLIMRLKKEAGHAVRIFREFLGGPQP